MSLTKKIGSYLCTAAMVFSLNVKTQGLFKEIIWGCGVTAELVVALACFAIKDKNPVNNSEHEKMVKKNAKETKMGQSCTKFLGCIFLADALQRIYDLNF